jgi:hypothetical protein
MWDIGGKAIRKEITRKTIRSWVDIVKMDLREIRWGGVDWIDVAQGRVQWRTLVNTVMNPPGSLKCWEVLENLHIWRLLKKGSAPWSLIG